MDNSWYKNFEDDIQAEIDDLFSVVCEKKQQAWELVSEYLSEESDFQSFLDQYDAFFQQHHLRISKLTREEISLKRQLEKIENDDGLLDLPDWMNSRSSEDEDEHEEEPAKNLEDGDFDFDAFKPTNGSESSKEQTEIERIQKQLESLKKRLSRTFLWIYHPRRAEQSDDQFYGKRSGLVTRLMNNPLYDAVDIILRIPFTERDKKLWRQPLPKQKLDEVTESLGDMWFRYRLWNRMMDVALPRAEAISTAAPHELYKNYQEMKDRDLQMILYFQELEVEKQNEIQELEVRVEKLRLNIEDNKD
ncbi:MAG: hypothetical protein Phog2KO_45270 [Phototrophicaceae bacterium]